MLSTILSLEPVGILAVGIVIGGILAILAVMFIDTIQRYIKF